MVVDASVAVDLLLARSGAALAEAVLSSGESLHAPHLLDLEVTQVLRRLVRSGLLLQERAFEALQDLEVFPLQRHPHLPHLQRIWQLRQNLTAYDAVYFALAEGLGCRLVTRDRALARMGDLPGSTVPVQLL